MNEPVDLKTKTAMVVDCGLFSHFAETLAKDYGKVLFFNPSWKRAFPMSRERYIADGLPNVEVVKNFYDEKDRADIFIFPDGGHGDWQIDLLKQGKLVWGSRRADELEQDRWAFKQEILKGLDMPVQPMERLVGITKLREHLKKHKGEVKYVKLSEERGDMESGRYEGDYDMANEAWLKQLDVTLGVLADDTEFIAEDKIDAVVEMGGDHYCIDGRYPESTLWGLEQKNASYIGAMVAYGDLPEPIQWANEKLSPILAQLGYRGGYSSELRVTKTGKVFYSDPCFRFPSPPSQGYPLVIGNWGDITWYGAQGILVKPRKLADYLIIAMIYAEHCDTRWLKYTYPKELADHYRFSFSMMLNGQRWTLPQHCEMEMMGAVCVGDDNLVDGLKRIKEYAGKLEGHNLHVRTDALLDGIVSIHAAQKAGYRFGDGKIPDLGNAAEILI